MKLSQMYLMKSTRQLLNFSAFNHAKAVVSVYFALILLPIAAIVLGLSEYVRINAQSAFFDSATSLACYSTFSKFAKEVYDEYGIFVYYSSEYNFTADLTDYTEKNMQSGAQEDTTNSFYTLSEISVSLDDISYITDSSGEIFANQAIKYIKTHITSELSESLVEIIKTYIDNEYDFSTDLSVPTDEETAEELANKAKETLSEYIDFSEDDEEEKTGSEDDIDDKNIIDIISDLMNDSLLTLCGIDTNDISTLNVSSSYIPSRTCYTNSSSVVEDLAGYITDADDATDVLGNLSDKALYLLYLNSKFSCYTDYSDNTATENELCYELEYILNRNKSEKENLSVAIKQLVLLRSGLNLAYLFTDAEKIGICHTAAMALVGSIPVPGIVAATTLVMMYAWATAEAIVDVRNLTAGKTVPVIKTKSSWNLSYENCFNLDSYLNDCDSSPGTSLTGLNYKQYLLILLYKESDAHLYLRTMDLIQLNIAKKYNSSFVMMGMISGADITLSGTGKELFTVFFDAITDGEYEIEKNISYSY